LLRSRRGLSPAAFGELLVEEVRPWHSPELSIGGHEARRGDHRLEGTQALSGWNAGGNGRPAKRSHLLGPSLGQPCLALSLFDQQLAEHLARDTSPSEVVLDERDSTFGEERQPSDDRLVDVEPEMGQRHGATVALRRLGMIQLCVPVVHRSSLHSGRRHQRRRDLLTIGQRPRQAAGRGRNRSGGLPLGVQGGELLGSHEPPSRRRP
jgi:hypothetical protein